MSGAESKTGVFAADGETAGVKRGTEGGKASDLVVRLRAKADEIDHQVRGQDLGDWNEIGLMREAADTLDQHASLCGLVDKARRLMLLGRQAWRDTSEDERKEIWALQAEGLSFSFVDELVRFVDDAKARGQTEPPPSIPLPPICSSCGYSQGRHSPDCPEEVRDRA